MRNLSKAKMGNAKRPHKYFESRVSQSKLKKSSYDQLGRKDWLGYSYHKFEPGCDRKPRGERLPPQYTNSRILQANGQNWRKITAPRRTSFERGAAGLETFQRIWHAAGRVRLKLVPSDDEFDADSALSFLTKVGHSWVR